MTMQVATLPNVCYELFEMQFWHSYYVLQIKGWLLQWNSG